MYLLYLDDSGSVKNMSERYLILAGLIVPERSLYWLNTRMDELAAKVSPCNPSIELHASEILRTRDKEPWGNYSFEDKIRIVKSVLEIAKNEFDKGGIRILGCAVEKAAAFDIDPMKLAFEDLCSRFNYFIQRKFSLFQEKDRGLIILDQSSYETSLQELAINFRKNGTQWNNKTSNLQEVPLFVNSKASRAIQLADHVAYALFRKYERNDEQYFKIIQGCFDSDRGRIFGLAHKTQDHECTCPACMSKKYARTQSYLYQQLFYEDPSIEP